MKIKKVTVFVSAVLVLTVLLTANLVSLAGIATSPLTFNFTMGDPISCDSGLQGFPPDSAVTHLTAGVFEPGGDRS